MIIKDNAKLLNRIFKKLFLMRLVFFIMISGQLCIMQ